MIGRAALTNPWVFSEVKAAFDGEFYLPPSDVATVDLIERYINLLSDEFPEKAAIGRVKQLVSQVTRRVPGTKMVRKALCTAKSLDEIRSLLVIWGEHLENGSNSWFPEDHTQLAVGA